MTEVVAVDSKTYDDDMTTTQKAHKWPLDGFTEIPQKGEGITIIDIGDEELFIHAWEDGVEICFCDKKDEAEDITDFLTFDELRSLIKMLQEKK